MALMAVWKFIVTTIDGENHGRLIFVVGPLGSGKNSVIAFALKIINKNNYLLAPRYVTRRLSAAAANSAGDDLPVSDTAFEHYRLDGRFALAWQAHGLWYGIGVEINAWLRSGKTVLVNGSRAYIETALTHYPALWVVHIQAPAQVTQARLTARGREDTAAIEARVQRDPAFRVPNDQLITIDNSGPLESAGQALATALLVCGSAQCSGHGGVP